MQLIKWLLIWLNTIHESSTLAQISGQVVGVFITFKLNLKLKILFEILTVKVQKQTVTWSNFGIFRCSLLPVSKICHGFNSRYLY